MGSRAFQKTAAKSNQVSWFPHTLFVQLLKMHTQRQQPCVCSHKQTSKGGMLLLSASECSPSGAAIRSGNSFLPDPCHWVTVLAPVMSVKPAGSRPGVHACSEQWQHYGVCREEPDAELWCRAAGNEDRSLVLLRTPSHPLHQGPCWLLLSCKAHSRYRCGQPQPEQRWLHWSMTTENQTRGSEMPGTALKPCCATPGAAYNDISIWLASTMPFTGQINHFVKGDKTIVLWAKSTGK